MYDQVNMQGGFDTFGFSTVPEDAAPVFAWPPQSNFQFMSSEAANEDSRGSSDIKGQVPSLASSSTLSTPNQDVLRSTSGQPQMQNNALQYFSNPSVSSHQELSPESISPTRSSASFHSPHGEKTAKKSGTKPKIPTARRSTKRKSPSDDEHAVLEQPVDPNKPPVKKKAHNMIEKRYRTNLNAKIAALRDSVPSLRVMSKAPSGNGGSDEQEDEDLDGLTPANKLNKASILTKATEYIQHLERRCRKLEDENFNLNSKVHSMGRILERSGFDATQETSLSPVDQAADGMAANTISPFSPDNTVVTNPQGMIEVPESIRRLRNAPLQPHYADQQIRYQHSEDNSHRSFGVSGHVGGRPVSRYMPNKLMVGSLAGLMCVGIVGTSMRMEQQSGDRGLAAIPLELVTKGHLATRHVLRSSVKSIHYLRSGLFLSPLFRPLIPFFNIMLVISIFALAIFLFLFNSKPRSPKKGAKRRPLTPVPSLASPIEVRRRAWLTSIQTVWVPRHRFVLELAAVTLKAFKYTVRKTFGLPFYCWLMSTTPADEAARVKAWDIAIDAQLAGGDEEISRSRLVLTIFASGTLPNSPSRLMLKALHLRILLWRISSSSIACSIADKVARAMAAKQWEMARTMYKATAQATAGSNDNSDFLPDHLAYLLEFDCEDVMTDSIIQRASNLAWDRPTAEACEGEDIGMDIVVQDLAISSPLDALAAWFSSAALHRALLSALEPSSQKKLFREQLDLAMQVAPPASTAQTRALAARAVFKKEDRTANIETVTSALPKPDRPLAAAPSGFNFIDSSTPMPACNGIKIAIRCAMILEKIKCDHESASWREAIADASALEIDPSNLSLLGFVSTYHLLGILSDSEDLTKVMRTDIISTALRKWAESDAAESNGLPQDLIEKVLIRCTKLYKATVKRRESLKSNDTGYVSAGE